MAIKLKSWTRSWLAKSAAALLIIGLGLFMIWNTYQQFEKNPNFELGTNYGVSSPYYEKLGAFYQDIYNAYYKNYPKTNKVLIDKLQTNYPGYYYCIVSNGSTYRSNIAGLNTESDFYNKVYNMRNVNNATEPVRIDNKLFFDQMPLNQDDVYIGIDETTYLKDSNAFITNWYRANAPFFTKMAISIASILLLMVYLALVSGRRPNEDKLHFHGLDTLFLDVYLLLWISFTALEAEFFFNVFSSIGEMASVIGFMVIATLWGLLGILYWTMVAKRVKSKELFKHTLVFWLLNLIFGGVIRFIHKLYSFVKHGPFMLLPILITLGIIAYNLFSVVLVIGLANGFGFFGFLIGGIFYMFGFAAIGLYLIYQDQQIENIIGGVRLISSGQLNHKLPETGSKQASRLASQINLIANGLQEAVQKEIKSEKMRSELITNVSHDIKTPLTSIISYVDLLKTQGLDSDEAPAYLEVLDQKSQRLKQLTEDLFEATKASSGTLQVSLESLHFQNFLYQSTGEFQERFESKHLELRMTVPETEVLISADGRHLWRITENLLLNTWKYSAEGTRVYLNLELKPNSQFALLTLKNISSEPLNIPASELMERFTRGDASRNTEGSGLGLSIAKSLTELQNGTFEIQTDGDLFKVYVQLPLVS